MKLRKRHRIRRKEIHAISEALVQTFGCTVFGIDDTVDLAQAPNYKVVLVNGKALAFVIDGVSSLTVKGIMEYGPTRSFIEVDMGAIPYVINGADVMSPGIVATDDNVKPADIVWVRDQRNHKPLAIGRALLNGPEMVSSKKGKAVKTLHYYGDELWNLEP